MVNYGVTNRSTVAHGICTIIVNLEGKVKDKQKEIDHTSRELAEL